MRVLDLAMVEEVLGSRNVGGEDVRVRVPFSTWRRNVGHSVFRFWIRDEAGRSEGDPVVEGVFRV